MGREKTQFKKGQSGNPNGKPKVPSAIREFKQTSYKDFLDKLQEFGALSPAEMKARVQDPNAKMFDVIFGRILYDASQGKSDARNVLLERLWGKVKDNDMHSVPFAAEQELMNRIPITELIELARKYQDKK